MRDGRREGQKEGGTGGGREMKHNYIQQLIRIVCSPHEVYQRAQTLLKLSLHWTREKDAQY